MLVVLLSCSLLQVMLLHINLTEGSFFDLQQRSWMFMWASVCVIISIRHRCAQTLQTKTLHWPHVMLWHALMDSLELDNHPLRTVFCQFAAFYFNVNIWMISDCFFSESQAVSKSNLWLFTKIWGCWVLRSQDSEKKVGSQSSNESFPCVSILFHPA